MDSFDELVMDIDRLKTQINELARIVNDMHTHVDKVGGMFKNFYVSNNKIIVALDRRISRLEGKCK